MSEEIKNAIPVSALSGYLKKIIDAEELLYNIRVYGEITDFSLSKNIAYFSIKDEGALIQCVCFSSEYYPLIKNGAQVVLTGSPKFWVKGGRLSFQVSKVEDYGKGKAYLEFLALKEKLGKLGYFDEAIKKPIPRFARRVGVVTSRTGAVIRDIKNVISRRNPYVDIVLYPSLVQGIGASETIIKGLKYLDNYDVDLIIIARGGGSDEDLMPFNNEALAHAIHEAKKPVVSAVGHETDFTICDFVSDLRAPTPSAAAELVTIDVQSFFDYLKSSLRKTELNIKSGIEARVEKLSAYKSKMNLLLNGRFTARYNAIEKSCIKLSSFMDAYYKVQKSKLDVLSGKFEKLNPLAILKQGYAKVSGENGNVLSAKLAKIGEKIEVSLSDGVIGAVINDVKEVK